MGYEVLYKFKNFQYFSKGSNDCYMNIAATHWMNSLALNLKCTYEYYLSLFHNTTCRLTKYVNFT